MIVEQLVPEVYYKDSRDFAFAGRLLEIVFNYMKTAADNVKVEPSENISNNIIELLINTLGFKLKHDYDLRDLVYLASSFSEILRNKGSIYAVELTLRTILNSQRIASDSITSMYYYDTVNLELIIYVPAEITDIALIEDVMDYILPAGILYRFVKTIAVVGDSVTKTNIATDTGNINYYQDKFTTRLYGLSQDLEEADNDAEEPENADTQYEIQDDRLHLGTIYTGTVIDSIIGTPDEEESGENNG